MYSITMYSKSGAIIIPACPSAGCKVEWCCMCNSLGYKAAKKLTKFAKSWSPFLRLSVQDWAPVTEDGNRVNMRVGSGYFTLNVPPWSDLVTKWVLDLTQRISSDHSGWVVTTDLYKVPDAVPPIHAESYHVAIRIRTPPSSGLFLATIYNQSQLAERKHVARYWSISAVP